MLEEVQFVLHETAIEFAHAVWVPEKVRPRVCQVVAGRVRYVVRDLDFFHLASIDRVWAEIARDR